MKTTFLKSMLGIFILCLAVMLNIKTSEASVLDGAKEWNGHFYKAFEFQLSRDKAQKFCVSMGGHLATAEIFDENAVIQEIIDSGSKREYLIGAYKAQNGIWRWYTGGVVTDSNWQKDYPGSYSPNMSMTKDGKGKWKTTHYWDDNNPYPFICEWDSKDAAHDSTM